MNARDHAYFFPQQNPMKTVLRKDLITFRIGAITFRMGAKTLNWVQKLILCILPSVMGPAELKFLFPY